MGLMERKHGFNDGLAVLHNSRNFLIEHAKELLVVNLPLHIGPKSRY